MYKKIKIKRQRLKDFKAKNYLLKNYLFQSIDCPILKIIFCKKTFKDI